MKKNDPSKDEGQAAANMPLLGRVVGGKFRIESFLGGGGMGAVFRARWIELDQVVAIKVIRPELADQPGFAARFKREAKAASRLDHPNSVRIIDFGVDGDIHYMAMEYVDGTHLLAELEDSWPISNERIVEILEQVLGALGKAHEIGIVHRDLKPENIMVSTQFDDEGRPTVKVCDFGIAKVMSLEAGQTSALTSNGLILGTPAYMSPEQGKGESIDARADIYSVGVILYQVLTRVLPFASETPLGLVYKHVSEPLIPPIELRPEVSPAFDAIVRKAMAKKPEDRFATARDMRRALRAAIGIEPAVSTVLPVFPGAKEGRGNVVELATARTEAAVERPVTQAPVRSLGAIGLVVGVVALVALGIGLGLRSAQTPAVPTPVETVATADADVQPDAAAAALRPKTEPEQNDVAPATSTAPSASSAKAPPEARGTRPPSTNGSKPGVGSKPGASAQPVPAVPAPPPSAAESATPAGSKKPVIEANPFL